jgi:ribosomal protein S18 acetylase RimI-like enzyme
MKKLDLIIRLANSSDTENIYHILSEAFKSYKKHYTKEAYKATVISIDEIEKRIKNHEINILVTLFNDRIVGTASIFEKNHNNLYISTMAVNPHYQKKGIGYQLLEYISNFARKKNFHQLSLESFKPLKSAIRLYEKYGFKKTGKKRYYYDIEIFEMIKYI